MPCLLLNFGLLIVVYIGASAIGRLQASTVSLPALLRSNLLHTLSVLLASKAHASRPIWKQNAGHFGRSTMSGFLSLVVALLPQVHGRQSHRRHSRGRRVTCWVWVHTLTPGPALPLRCQSHRCRGRSNMVMTSMG